MKTFLRKLRHKIIINKLSLPPNARVLDTSCQDGTFLKVLIDKNKDKNLKVFGVDIDSQELKKAQTLLPEGSFLVTDSASLPYPDKTFDIVINSMTLHHIAQPEIYLLEIKRILKDDGTLYLIDIITKNSVWYKILNFIKCPAPYHFEKFYAFSEVQSLLTKVGFNIEKTDPTWAFPTFTVGSPAMILSVKC